MQMKANPVGIANPVQKILIFRQLSRRKPIRHGQSWLWIEASNPSLDQRFLRRRWRTSYQIIRCRFGRRRANRMEGNRGAPRRDTREPWVRGVLLRHSCSSSLFATDTECCINGCIDVFCFPGQNEFRAVGENEWFDGSVSGGGEICSFALRGGWEDEVQSFEYDTDLERERRR